MSRRVERNEHERQKNSIDLPFNNCFLHFTQAQTSRRSKEFPSLAVSRSFEKFWKRNLRETNEISLSLSVINARNTKLNARFKTVAFVTFV
jgi:hypothetical protein